MTEALGGTRRYVDATLMLGLGIASFVAAGSISHPVRLVLLGVLAVLHSGYIALSRRSYVMPYVIYAGAAVAVLWFIFG